MALLATAARVDYSLPEEAAFAGDKEAVKSWLDDRKERLDALGPRGMAVMHIAAINGQHEDWLRGVLDKLAVALGLGAQGALQREGYDLFLLDPTQDGLARVKGWYDGGALTPAMTRTDSTFRLGDDDEGITKAMERMKSRCAVGEIIIEM